MIQGKEQRLERPDISFETATTKQDQGNDHHQQQHQTSELIESSMTLNNTTSNRTTKNKNQTITTLNETLLSPPTLFP